MRIDEGAQEAQITSVQNVRAQRDLEYVNDVLRRIRITAQDADAPLMPLFVEATAAYATLGEICGVLREVFGEYQAPTLI